MARFLVVTWDGAGNLVPTLGITRDLVRAGHDVHMLGHDTIAERCGSAGARFIPFEGTEGWDHMDDPDDFEAEVELMIDKLCFSSSIARETAAEIERERPDVVMVDCMLFTATSAAQASGLPTATLFHVPYTIFRGGPLVEMFSPGLERLNAHRVELGLAPVETLGDVHDACDVALIALPSEFEPMSGDAPNVVRIGPILDAPPLTTRTDDVDIEDGSTPLVLVSLSTSEQGQADLLQRIVDAVAGLAVRVIVTTGPSIDPATVNAGENTDVVSYVPHAELLPSTSLVITHAGLGTVMSALANGVPLLCTPMGRDQFFNAEQVQALGAGRMLMADTDVSAIADAAQGILDDAQSKAAAKQMANIIAGYGGASDAVAALERLSRER